MKHMSNVASPGIFGEKAPFLVTLIFGILAWGVTHIVDRVTAAPTIEYREALSPLRGPAAEVRKIEVRLHNLSSNDTYYNTTFILSRRTGSATRFLTNLEDKQHTPDVVAEEPAWFGETSTTKRSIDPSDDHIDFIVPQIPPDGRIRIIAFFTGDGVPLFRAKLNADDKSTMRLVPPSIETFLVRNETLLILAAMLSAVAGYSVLWLSRNSTRRLMNSLLALVVVVGLFAPFFSY